jgi:pilus assembly protein CpaB
VSQLIIKNVQVLHIGTFPLTKEEETQQPQPGQEGATPTPAPTAVVAVERPDIITLIVSPQDAVTLTYLVYSGAQLTLTLRNPNDNGRYDTEAATLNYILAQYNIPVPVGLPYGMQPRIDELIQPNLPNDVIVVIPQQ